MQHIPQRHTPETCYTQRDYCSHSSNNKANLLDLIAATGLVIILKLDPNHRFFSLCDLEIWWLTLKNNRAPLIATSSFLHHFVAIRNFKLELQFRNAKFGSNSTIVRAVWPWCLMDDLEKTIGHLSPSFVNSKWSYGPETVKLSCDFCDLDLWPLTFAWTSHLSLVITPENFMMIQWWGHSEKGVTDRHTDRHRDGLSHS